MLTVSKYDCPEVESDCGIGPEDVFMAAYGVATGHVPNDLEEVKQGASKLLKNCHCRQVKQLEYQALFLAVSIHVIFSEAWSRIGIFKCHL